MGPLILIPQHAGSARRRGGRRCHYPSEVAASAVEASEAQTQVLAQTAQRIFSAPGRRLGDTRPLSTRLNVTNRPPGSRQVADLELWRVS